MIAVRESGLVYRNPRPELRSHHAWHPSLIRFDDGELVCVFDAASADQALDYRSFVTRSTDGGATWSKPERVIPDWGDRPITTFMRVSRLRDGTLVGFGARMFRDDPDAGIVNTPGIGYADMDLFLARSADRGRTWSAPEPIHPPFVGPSWEVCHAIVELADGRWLAPVSSWMGWHGDAADGMRAAAFLSHDRGATWPEALTEFDRWADDFIHWEQSLLQLPDGRLLAVAWSLNWKTGAVEPTPYAMAPDGQTFSVRGLTGFLGQTTKLALLPDGRIFAAYRRQDQPGLWGTTARLDGDRWVNLETAPLWQGAPSGMTGQMDTGNELLALSFGYPSMAVEPSGDILLAFWCREDCIVNIRWLRITA
jgi:hypothetical protein